MDNINIDKKKKRKKILWKIAGILGVLGVFMLIIFLYFDIDIGTFIASLLIFSSFIIALINVKHYNTIPFLVGLVILAMFFKFMHWHGSGVLLTISLGLLSIILIITSLKYTKNKNTFLKWIGFSANIIVPLMFLALLFKSMHWSGGNVMGYIGTFSFVVFIFAMIFTLPNSKYIEWTKIDKKSFYRSIIIPLFFIFTLTTMDFLANDTLQYILGDPKYRPETAISFEMNDVAIIPHEGIIK